MIGEYFPSNALLNIEAAQRQYPRCFYPGVSEHFGFRESDALKAFIGVAYLSGKFSVSGRVSDRLENSSGERDLTHDISSNR